MNSQEWALLIFTLFCQAAVGTFIVLWIADAIVKSKYGKETANRFSSHEFLVVAPLLFVGLIASATHVGNLLNAPYAVSNFATSWLSREIILSGLFTLLVVVFTFLHWRKMGADAVQSVIALVTAVTGLVFVYSMARVYMIQAVPIWNSTSTLVSFFATTFLLGALIAGVTLIINYNRARKADPGCGEKQCQLLQTSIRWFSIVAVVAMGVLVMVSSLQLSYVAAIQAPGAGLMYKNFGLLLAIRLVLVFVGAGLLGIFTYNAAGSQSKLALMSTLTFSALALVMVAEVIGRYLFYATYARIGL